MLTQFHHIYTSMMKITTTITLKRKKKKKKDYMSHVKVYIDECITEHTYTKNGICSYHHHDCHHCFVLLCANAYMDLQIFSVV